MEPGGSSALPAGEAQAAEGAPPRAKGGRKRKTPPAFDADVTGTDKIARMKDRQEKLRHQREVEEQKRIEEKIKQEEKSRARKAALQATKRKKKAEQAKAEKAKAKGGALSGVPTLGNDPKTRALVALISRRDQLEKERRRLQSELNRSTTARARQAGSMLPVSRRELDDVEVLREPLRIKGLTAFDERVPGEWAGDLLLVYDFVRTFSGPVVELTPFSLPQLIDALTLPSPCLLVCELHMAFLRLLLTHAEHVVGPDCDDALREAFLGCEPDPSVVDECSWAEVMRRLVPALRSTRQALGQEATLEAAWFADQLSGALGALGQEEHHRLGLPHKLALLRVLIDACFDTPPMEEHLTHLMRMRNTVYAQRQEKEKEERKAQREITAARREQVIKELQAKLDKERAAALASKGPDGKDAKLPPAQPTATMIANAMDALARGDFPGGDLEVRELPAEEPLSDDDEEGNGDTGDGDGSTTIAQRRRGRGGEEQRAQRRAWKQKEREKRRWLEVERPMALEALESAVREGTARKLKAALKRAKAAELEGEGWCISQVRDAYKTLHDMEERDRKLAAESDFLKSLSEFAIRTERLGDDRLCRTYYRLCSASDTDLILVETKLHHETKKPLVEFMEESFAARRAAEHQLKHQLVQARMDDVRKLMEIQAQLLQRGLPEDQATREAAAEVCKGEMAPLEPTVTGQPVDPHSFVSVFETIEAYDDNVKKLVRALDPRGPRERALRSRLLASFELEEPRVDDDFQWSTTGSSLIGQKVRRKFEAGTNKRGDAVYTWGTGRVVGWVSAEANDGLELYHVEHEDGDEEDLERHEVEEGMRLAEEAETNGTSSDKKGPTCSGVRKYVNHQRKGDGPRSEEDLGLPALRRLLVNAAEALDEVLAERGEEQWMVAEGNRRDWDKAVNGASAAVELIEPLLLLEHGLHGLQEGQDAEEEEEGEEEDEDDEQTSPGTKGCKSTDSRGGTSESEEDDSDTIGTADASERRPAKPQIRRAKEQINTLWPSMKDCQRWRSDVREAETSAMLALSLRRLIEASEVVGVSKVLQRGKRHARVGTRGR